MPHGVKSTDLVTKGLVVTLTQAFSQGPKRGRLILVQWYMYSKEGGGGGGGGFEKTFVWKFEFYVTYNSCQYMFQACSKFFNHTWLCDFVPGYASLLNYDIFRYTIK